MSSFNPSITSSFISCYNQVIYSPGYIITSPIILLVPLKPVHLASLPHYNQSVLNLQITVTNTVRSSAYQRRFELFTFTRLLGGAINHWLKQATLPGCANTPSSVEVKLNAILLQQMYNQSSHIAPKMRHNHIFFHIRESAFVFISTHRSFRKYMKNTADI